MSTRTLLNFSLQVDWRRTVCELGVEFALRALSRAHIGCCIPSFFAEQTHVPPRRQLLKVCQDLAQPRAVLGHIPNPQQQPLYLFPIFLSRGTTCRLLQLCGLGLRHAADDIPALGDCNELLFGKYRECQPSFRESALQPFEVLINQSGLE